MDCRRRVPGSTLYPPAGVQIIEHPRHPLLPLFAYFLRLGFTAFGGPAAHISMMQRDVVERYKWLTEQEFLDAVGAANLIPGPTSTELALYVGRKRAGLAGLITAGVGFIGPAMLLSMLLAWVYTRTSMLPQMGTILSGIQAAVISIIAAAAWKLARPAAKTRGLVLLGVAAATASALGAGELWVLIGAGVVYMLIIGRLLVPGRAGGFTVAGTTLGGSSAWAAGTTATATASYSALATMGAWGLGVYFLIVGSVLYGSGYVLIAFLEGGLVTDTGLLTRRQLLDAVAAGQFTPGPVSSTATFIGFLLHGIPGAVLCTLAIFLPSFVFVSLLGGWVPRLRNSRATGAFLDGVNVAAIALIAVVAVKLGLETWHDLRLLGISAVALTLLVTTRLNPTWLVLGGALAGWALIPHS